MALQYKNTLPLQALAIVTFGIYLAVAFELALQLTALISLSLSLGVSLTLPTIALSLSLTAALILQFNLALGLTLPSLVINLKLALEYELGIVIGLILAIEAIASASLLAYAYVGSGSALGSTLQAQIADGWPDGTPPHQSMTAYFFVATATGPHTSDQVSSASLIAPPPTPPTPPPPSPPPGSYPPPQAYEWGLASISFPSQVYPTVVYPSDPATGTLTLDNSVTTGIGAITGVTITHNGSGYTAPAIALISDSVSIVSATVASPVVLTLPHALSIPVGKGFGITVAGVAGTTAVQDATNATPIVITVADTASLSTVTISGALGNDGANGQWYAQVLSSTTAALFLDEAMTIPASGTGAYTGGGSLCGNVNGLRCAKVLTPTTVALYVDSSLTVPVAGYGTYAGGTVTGGGTGAAANVTMGGGAQHALKSFFSGLLWPAGLGPDIAGGVTTISLMCGTTFALLAELLSNLNARKGLLLSATASASIAVLPPSITASLDLLAKISANLTANLKIKLPSLSAHASAALSAQIGIIGRLFAGVSFMLGIGNVNLEIWEYTGPGSGLQNALAGGPGQNGWHDGTPAGNVIAAGVFGLTNSASATAFGAFFGGI